MTVLLLPLNRTKTTGIESRLAYRISPGMVGIDFGTAETTPRWHSGPNERGTFQLLTECIITMALCVWTAVHLNVPEFNNPGKHARIRTGWVLLGLFAPELVAWTAYEQRREAMTLHRKIKEILGEEVALTSFEKITLWIRGRKARNEPDEEAASGREAHGKEAPTRKHAWTKTHSFFAVMGGFAFGAEAMDTPGVLPGSRNRATITPEGLLRLAQIAPRLLPDISTGYINDKSKADGLAKALVILQASWFVLQCVARVAGGLTLSLLELNTWSHAVCALLAYALWWHKPLNVEEPTLIRGDDVELVCAAMSMRSPMGTLMEADDFIVGEKMVARLWFEKHGYMDLDTPEYGMMESWIMRTQQEEEDRQGDSHSPLSPSATASNPNTTSSSSCRSEWEPPGPTPVYVAVDPPCEPPPPSNPFRLYMGQRIYGFGFRRGRWQTFSAGSTKFGANRTSLGALFFHLLSWRSPQGRFVSDYFSTWSNPPTILFSVLAVVEKCGVMSLQRPSIPLSTTDLTRLRLACETYAKYPDFFEPITDTQSLKYGSDWSSAGSAHRHWTCEDLTDRVPNLPFRGLMAKVSAPRGRSMLLSMIISGIFYGGIHLLAWAPPSASRSEVLLWRMSSLVLALYVVPRALLACLPEPPEKDLLSTLKGIPRKVESLVRQPVRQWSVMFILRDILGPLAVAPIGLILLFTVFLGFPVYLAARVYLPLEAILSIPRLPDSVFVTPEWSEFLPHLS